MAGAFIVVLIVASGTSDDPSTTLVAKTAQNALDEQTIVVVRDVESKKLLNHAEASRVGESLAAGAIVVLSWKNRQQSASLHVRADRTTNADWIEKTLTFADADPTAERMKTVGFEVAAIIARRASTEKPLTPGAPGPETRGDDLPKASSSAAPTPAVTAAPPTTASTGADSPIEPRLDRQPPKAVTEPARIAIDALGHSAWAGAGGVETNSFGGELGARFWLLNGWLAPHVAVGGRFASDGEDATQTNSFVWRGSLGAAMRFVRPNHNRRFGIGARSDLHLFSHHVSRADNPASTGSATVGGVSGVFEASWRWWRSISMVGAGGLEVAFGSVDVFVDDRKASTIRPVRAVFELGARWTPSE